MSAIPETITPTQPKTNIPTTQAKRLPPCFFNPCPGGNGVIDEFFLDRLDKISGGAGMELPPNIERLSGGAGLDDWPFWGRCSGAEIGLGGEGGYSSRTPQFAQKFSPHSFL